MVSEKVHEIQGWYGSFTLSERVLQKIWLRQDFERSGLKTLSGKALEIMDPGEWNRLGGPDFMAAKFKLNGEEVRGDVEVHFNADDWMVHQHELNPAFNAVVLHVLLYADSVVDVQTLGGSVPETLVLMPLLERDLESIAMDEALLEMERVNELEWVADFLKLSIAARTQRLTERADARWLQKCHFAAKRLDAHGWAEACHQLCLEVLGYSRNRAPMAQLALKYPLPAMRNRSADELYAATDGWKLSGLRPANRPRSRLQQYLQVLEEAPDWYSGMELALRRLPPISGGDQTILGRRKARLAEWCLRAREQLFGGQLGETRFHTLMVDALLPLAEAAGILQGRDYWMHWYVGDAPVALRRFLKLVEVTSREQPNTNGLTQGALSLFCSEGG